MADQVTVLVFAPRQWEDRFDRHGCLLPEAWEAAHVPLDAGQVHVVEGPAEQADRVARCLAAYQGKYRPDEITIGLADEALTPHLQRQLQRCGLACRPAAGIPITQTAPYRLLAAVADDLQTDRYPEFAALVRHPDLHDWLERQGFDTNWLQQLDEYFAEHLPAKLGGRWLGSAEQHQLCRRVYQRIAQWLEPLRGQRRPWHAWHEALRGLLLQVYGHRTWDRDDPGDRLLLAAFRQLNEVWDSQGEASIPAKLAPLATAAEALRLTLRQLENATLPAPQDPQAIELLGWLELPWDDAPALVVTGFNEGYVPSAINSDLFLPNTLRTRLGLQDNARRYARDAYALGVLLATRERVDLIVARRNLEGDPLAPSRLLFAADAETIAERAMRFFQPPQPLHELPPLRGRQIVGHEQSRLPVPRPAPLSEPIRELAVTAFRDYLACPYRFYLGRVLNLQDSRDAAEELDGSAFGSLLHDVLRDFGTGPCRDSSDPEEIRGVLDQALQRHVQECYGGAPLSAVRVQVEQLRLRLAAFAKKQAERAAAGWRIEHVEAPGRDHRTVWEVDGQPVILRGRIDRIDVHPETGERIVFDYKSSDSPKTPEQVHRRNRQWVDLQLPLYRHVAQTLGISHPRLGYILLPKDTSRVEFCLAEWTDAELEEADEVARGVIRGIRAEVFWPPVEPPPDFSERFAPICQDGVLEKDLG